MQSAYYVNTNGFKMEGMMISGKYCNTRLTWMQTGSALFLVMGSSQFDEKLVDAVGIRATPLHKIESPVDDQVGDCEPYQFSILQLPRYRAQG